MSTWSKNELQRIAENDDLHISPFREDGKTYGTPTWIWSVAVDGALYVRAYNGQDSRWYQAAMENRGQTGPFLTKTDTEPQRGEFVDYVPSVPRFYEGGSLNSGGPERNEYTASFLGFQYNFKTKSLSFSPSKSFRFGLQVLVGGEFSFNPDTYLKLGRANDACRAQGGS